MPSSSKDLPIVDVESQSAWAEWLKENHAESSGVWLRLAKKGSGLRSVTYDEAVGLGIDNLEHGFQANTAMDPDKKPDTCSASGGVRS